MAGESFWSCKRATLILIVALSWFIGMLLVFDESIANNRGDIPQNASPCNTNETEISLFDVHDVTSVIRFIYFVLVTVSTVGYGDFHPLSCENRFKGFVAALVLISAVILPFLTGLFVLLLARLEGWLVAVALPNQMVQSATKIKWQFKIFLSLFTVFVMLGLGMILYMWCEENPTVLDAFYFSSVSVTTVGYGDLTLKTGRGQLAACVWILFSTILVTIAFGYIAEVTVDYTRRTCRKNLLDREFTEIDYELARNGQAILSEMDYIFYKVSEVYGAHLNDLLSLREKYTKLHPARDEIVVALEDDYEGMLSLEDAPGREIVYDRNDIEAALEDDDNMVRTPTFEDSPGRENLYDRDVFQAALEDDDNMVRTPTFEDAPGRENLYARDVFQAALEDDYEGMPPLEDAPRRENLYARDDIEAALKDDDDMVRTPTFEDAPRRENLNARNVFQAALEDDGDMARTPTFEDAPGRENLYARDVYQSALEDDGDMVRTHIFEDAPGRENLYARVDTEVAVEDGTEDDASDYEEEEALSVYEDALTDFEMQ